MTNEIENQQEPIQKTPVNKEEIQVNNVQQDAAVFSDLGKPWDEEAVYVIGPAGRREEVIAAAQKMPNEDLEKHKEGREWLGMLREGYSIVPSADLWNRTVDRKDASFRQMVQSEAGPLSVGQPRFHSMDGKKITGERAVLRVRAVTGSGGLIQIPLWHSGFWITLKTPSDAALLELERKIVDEKIILGRVTNGAVFANSSVYIANAIINMMQEHLYDTTLINRDNLLEKIVSHDIQAIAWGLACTIWPAGFQYARAVIDENGQEIRTVREKINVGKIQWTDTQSLTPWQIAHMSNRNGCTMSDDAIRKYREEFTIGKTRQVTINERLKFNLFVPNVKEYLDAGSQWVDSIVVGVDRSFAYSDDIEERNRYIFNLSRATYMRQFSHWVKSIEVYDDLIDDKETIDEVLGDLSTNDDIRKQYFADVNKYIEDSTISVIAVPTVSEVEENKFPRFPRLLPIDAMSTFFTLLAQKTQAIKARN